MIKNEMNALEDETIKKCMWSKKKERQRRKKDKEEEREIERNRERDGRKEIDEYKNLIFSPNLVRGKVGEGGGVGCSLQNYLPSQFLSQFSAQPKLMTQQLIQ